MTVDTDLATLRSALDVTGHDGFCAWCGIPLYEGSKVHADGCDFPLATAALYRVETELARLREELDRQRDAVDHHEARAEAAEARLGEAHRECARLQQALTEIAAIDGYADEGRPVYFTLQSAFHDAQRIARAALAAHNTPADSPGIECDGSPYCMASPHMHGCFADKGDCDHPAEHADSQEGKT